MLIPVIFGLVFSLIIVLIFVRYEYALAFYIAYFILVPVTKIPAAIQLPIGSKFMNLLFFVVFVFNHKEKIKSFHFKPLEPFFYFFLAMGVLILFQDFTYLGENVISLFNKVLTCVFFPYVIYGTIIYQPKSAKIIGWSLLISGTIFTVYGIFLTATPGVNPYLIKVLPLFGEEFNTAYALGYSGLSDITNASVMEGRMFGRISSVFKHPMTYTLNLGLFFFFVSYFFKNNKVMRGFYYLLIGIAVLVSGVRSPILSMILTIIIAVIHRRKIKYATYVAIIVFVFVLLLPMISEDLYNYVSTVFGGRNTVVSGSSLSMRIKQFVSCFDIISDCIIQGKGYSWNSIYLKQHEIHPTLLAFESLVFVVLCNTGLIGVCIWIYLVIKVKGYCNTVKNKEMELLLICYSVYYLFYSCITGDFGYMVYFLIYYALFAGIYESRKRIHRLLNVIK